MVFPSIGEKKIQAFYSADGIWDKSFYRVEPRFHKHVNSWEEWRFDVHSHIEPKEYFEIALLIDSKWEFNNYGRNFRFSIHDIPVIYYKNMPF